MQLRDQSWREDKDQLRGEQLRGLTLRQDEDAYRACTAGVSFLFLFFCSLPISGAWGSFTYLLDLILVLSTTLRRCLLREKAFFVLRILWSLF